MVADGDPEIRNQNPHHGVRRYLRLYRGWKWYAAFLLLLVTYYLILPKQLFQDPYSTVLEDASGELLSASIAPDGQWRFPQTGDVSDKFAKALLAYEDKNFYKHFGVDPLALARAIKQDIAAGSVVSGGSTITMQVIRLSRKGKSRTVFEKVIEMVMATRLELRDSKMEILSMYASHAPFGGNVVGVDAACWRYFGRESSQLSWGEAALLAVLPNSPSLMHPGRNRDALKRKRDLLLDKLKERAVIDEVTCALSKGEPIPLAPKPLPRMAHHLLVRAAQEGHDGKVVQSTLSYQLQNRVEQIVEDHHQRLRGNQISNAAAMVLDVNSGNVLAYVGNTYDPDFNNQNEVDIIRSRRSTGSILKPFLYAAMLDEGKILPQTLLPDVPILINGFSPKNFSGEYNGVVHADDALTRSLNVPAVHLLKDYRYEKFYHLLKGMGMRSLNRPADHYGLAMILGGAEGTLWEISGIYASMARTLKNFFDRPGKLRYDLSDFHGSKYMCSTEQYPPVGNLEATSWLSAASIFQTFNALTNLNRPAEESGWRHFTSSKKIAWKTGTSYGFRDGWSIGVTPDHVVAVWVGNADGEGRPGLTGTDGAAPLMFDIFSQLESNTWFQKPIMEMQQIAVCLQSGQRVNDHCKETDSLWVVKSGLQSQPCSFHKVVHLTKDKKFRVHSGCLDLNDMTAESWFILPPDQEHYYRSKHVYFRRLPAFRGDCEANSTISTMGLIYPKANSRIFIPRDLDGTAGRTIFELAHRDPELTVHWHLDGMYVGSTRRKHFLPVNPPAGRHTLVLIDENGEEIEEHFEVLSKM